jgi:exonuclease I
VIDPQGQVRYAIYKKFDSESRRARQHAAIHGPLKDFWKKTGRRYDLLPNVLRRVHAL